MGTAWWEMETLPPWPQCVLTFSGESPARLPADTFDDPYLFISKGLLLPTAAEQLKTNPVRPSPRASVAFHSDLKKILLRV